MDSQINLRRYLPIEERAAGDAYPHANLQRLHHRVMHHHNGDDVAYDQGSDVNQHLVQPCLVLLDGISSKVVDDPTLKDWYHHSYYATLKEKLKFNDSNELIKSINLKSKKKERERERER